MSTRRLAKVPLFGNIAKAVTVNLEATVGAQIGVDLLMPDGTVGTLAQLQKLFGAGTSTDSALTTTDDLDEGQWNLWFTKRRAQDAVGEILADTTTIDLAYTAGTSIEATLKDLADSGTGAALVKITRDAKGRIGGTSAATTTDLTEGTNLYFTAARVLSTLLTGLSTATNAVITAADNVLSALGKLQAQVTANLSALALKLDRVGDSVELAGGNSLKQVDAITTTYLQNAGGLFIGTNIEFDGTNWNRGDTSKAGVLFSQRADLAGYEVRIDSGAGLVSVLYGDATGLKILGNVAWHAGNFDPTLKANDSAVLHNTGNETASGVKTLTSSLRVSVPSDFWTTSGTTIFGSEGYFGSNGSLGFSLRANGYRNNAMTWTSLARGGFAGASGIDMRPTGLLLFGADSAAPTGFDVTWRWQMTTTSFQPVTDNVYTVGDASHRPSVIWAGTGTISTSDGREKTAVAPLTSAEIAAAGDLARAIGTYQWLAMIDAKGADAARHHAGLTVQQAIAIMQAHGLDPFRYGFICYDQWEATPEVWEDVPAQVDEDGNETVPASRVLTEPARPAGDRYSFRDTELDHFLARGAAAERDELKARVADLSARLDALEARAGA